MNIFQSRIELEPPGRDFVANGREALLDFLKFPGLENARGDQRPGMSYAATDVMSVETPVRGDGFPVRLQQVRGVLLKPTFPHCLGIRSGWIPLRDSDNGP